MVNLQTFLNFFVSKYEKTRRRYRKNEEITIYEVIGYKQYSPLFEEGKLNESDKKVKFVLDIIKNTNKKVYELGAGAGRWIYLIEKKLKIKVIGYDINNEMIRLWRLLKKKEKLKSKIIKKNILKIKQFDNKALYLLLDNFIMHFSYDDLVKIISKISHGIIEIQEASLKDGSTIEWFSDNKRIIENIKKLDGNKFKRTFSDGKVSCESILYLYNIRSLEKILRNCNKKIKNKRKFDRTWIIEFCNNVEQEKR